MGQTRKTAGCGRRPVQTPDCTIGPKGGHPDRRTGSSFAAVASILLTARFATTVARLAQLPGDGAVPEVAFVGRSNAGKSSAINALCQQRRLAFASKTPGRTQALNYFALGPARLPPQ